MPGYWLFSVLGVGITYVDVRRHRLPHVTTGALWSSCGTLFVIESVHSGRSVHLIEAMSSGLAVSAAMLLIALAAPGQLGLGDVHFAGAVAFTLGWLRWEIAAVAVVIALAIQWIWTLIAVARTRDRKIALPFGPALFGAWVIAITVA
jgi:leader peptidase (prepilin peptidase)/N-methyltransferase